ncbi:polysaccharide pyruvyl transferase family protein [Sphingosinicellaceae bacterium]|nr:polysaccharide pyruvyl transferase family protein [Sphingosinicellaceae bacterium]
MTVLDTSVPSNNLGDEIIMDAVYDVVHEVLPNAYINRVGTHDYLGEYSRKLIAASDFSIFGGTNMLDPDMLSKGALWKLRLSDVGKISPVVLLGVGWRRYGEAASWSSRRLLNSVLSTDFVHSVRDSYTLDRLAGIKPKASNTACMTMWRLDAAATAKLPRTKATRVVTTLTFYSKDEAADRRMLELLKGNYATVAIWSQQAPDLAYLESLGVPGIEVIPPTLRAYNSYLDNEDIDFIGTRLHGGVRAMQKGHRALIIGIDNRATEIARDTGLPVVPRGSDEAISAWIHAGCATTITLPTEAIAQWKAQF